MMRRLFSFPTLYAYALLIIVLSVIPISIRYPVKYPLDKVAHFFIYLIFSFLISNTLAAHGRKNFRLKGIVYAFIVGLLIEIVQWFIPYRTFEVSDIAANFSGVVLGVIVRINL